MAFPFYIGTYTTQNGAEGIYEATFDPQRCRFSDLRLAARTQNPSYLAMAADRYLLAVNELSEYEGRAEGAVTLFKREKENLVCSDQTGSGGRHPCYVSTSCNDCVVAVANYSSGSCSWFE
ncbi:MAG: hypothetical protein D6820_18545, partial [Lentisphaerae bacterium]